MILIRSYRLTSPDEYQTLKDCINTPMFFSSYLFTLWKICTMESNAGLAAKSSFLQGNYRQQVNWITFDTEKSLNVII